MSQASPDQFDAAVEAFRRGDFDRARSLAERQLQSSQSPQLHHLIGLIDCRMGKLGSGVEWLSRASQAEPDNIAFKVMLARALVDSGQAATALEVAALPSGASPPELALLHVRAEAADAAGATDAAVESWGRLCAANPGDWRSWSNYGNALAAADRWPESVKAYRRAVALNSEELPLRRALAAALARAGRHDESADVLQDWVDSAPENPGNQILLARLLADLGRDSESAAQLDKAAKLATGRPFSEDGAALVAMAGRTASGEIDADLLRELARLLERTSRLDALRALLSHAESLGIGRERLGYPAAAVALKDGDPAQAKRLLLGESPDSDPVRWHWLMARIADSLDDPETAFAEAEAMNRSSQDYDRWRAEAARHLDWAGRLADRITPEWAGGIRALAPDKRRSPAFLVGFPRSGTTLLDTFLMGHPGAHVLEEVPLIHAVESVLGKIDCLPERSAAELQAARDAYFAQLDRHVPQDFYGLVVDKLPLNLLAAPFLHALFPDARFIFAQRHPCDCVLSCFMQGFVLNSSMACFLDIADSARFYDCAMTVWTRARDALRLRSHILVYEHLVADPESALRPLVDYLGLDWKPGLLDHQATAKSRGAISTPSYDQVVQPLSERAVDRWRRYGKQLEPVLPVLLPWAERLGYEK